MARLISRRSPRASALPRAKARRVRSSSASVEGKLGADGVFRSNDVIIKHDNSYQPPSDGTHPGGAMPSLAEGS